MNLLELDEETKVPKPTAECLCIPQFRELYDRSRPIDGDRDGKKRLVNMAEFAYVGFMGRYDSRWKLLHGKDREDVIKKLIGLKEQWIADSLVKECLSIYVDSQTTESTELVEVLSNTIQNLTKFLKTSQEQLATLGISDAKGANDFLNVVDRIPKTVEGLRKAKEQLNREQDALAKGRKGRSLNKYEIPDT